MNSDERWPRAEETEEEEEGVTNHRDRISYLNALGLIFEDIGGRLKMRSQWIFDLLFSRCQPFVKFLHHVVPRPTLFTREIQLSSTLSQEFVQGIQLTRVFQRRRGWLKVVTRLILQGKGLSDFLIQLMDPVECGPLRFQFVEHFLGGEDYFARRRDDEDLRSMSSVFDQCH